MPKERFRWRVPESSRGGRLDQEIVEGLARLLAARKKPPLSKSRVRALLVAGAVYLDRARVRIASKAVRPGAEIEVIVDFDRLSEASREKPFALTPADVLFEDEWLLVVAKPAGLPTQPTLDEARANLFSAAQKYLARKTGDAGAYLGLHHRLDRDTSGVVLFTKKKEANAGIADLFAGKSKGEGSELEKVYLALVEKPWGKLPERRWTVKNNLGPVGKIHGATRYGAVRSGGDPAVTEFRFLGEAGEGLLLIEARPITGRTHQIRVHLSEAGLPIRGDRFYSRSSPGSSGDRLLLHAHRLEFRHPQTGAKVQVEAPLPEEFRMRIERNPSSHVESGDREAPRRKPHDPALPLEVPEDGGVGDPRPPRRRPR